MILEVAVLNIKKEQSEAFEKAFHLAGNIISSMDGYLNQYI